jgi:hypothetical protein
MPDEPSDGLCWKCLGFDQESQERGDGQQALPYFLPPEFDEG